MCVRVYARYFALGPSAAVEVKGKNAEQTILFCIGNSAAMAMSLDNDAGAYASFNAVGEQMTDYVVNQPATNETTVEYVPAVKDLGQPKRCPII